MKKDKYGRITNLDLKTDDGLIEIKNDVGIYGGDSVCNTCGKNMPKCWDTVCYICGDTSCYKCSYSDDKHWYCFKHRKYIGEAHAKQ